MVRDQESLSVAGSSGCTSLFMSTLQRDMDLAWFSRAHRRQSFSSAALMAPKCRHFVSKLER